jgi:FkbM family methyltransferase
MGQLLNRIYRRYESPGALSVAKARNLEFSWVIEAGCHDGRDTLTFANLEQVSKIFAFEPDPVAMASAKLLLSDHVEKIVFNSAALMDRSGFVSMHEHRGLLGTGNTIFTFSTQPTPGGILCTTLDSAIQNPKGDGLLWLDVEGAPHLVLSGGERTLSHIVIAQIEIDLHSTSDLREANYKDVHKIMRRNGFKLVFAPLHPGFFGDVLYLKNQSLTKLEKFRSVLLTLTYLTLHRWLYPLLRKH